MYVQGLSSNVLAHGQRLTIWGGFFDESCQVLFDDVFFGRVENVGDDFIDVVAPLASGTYSIVIIKGSSYVMAGSIRVVQLNETPLPCGPKNYLFDDFVDYVRGLFPRGSVLDLSASSNFGRLGRVIARSVGYLWGVISQMYVEMDPTHTTSFETWEADLGLPVGGVVVNDFNDRRSEIWRVACCNGGCSVNYVWDILRRMGYAADVVEYYLHPEAFADYNFPAGADRNFYWLVELPVDEVNMQYADCETGDCESYLCVWGDKTVESVINAIKPAHSVVLFVYREA